MLTFIKRTATSWQHDNDIQVVSFGGGIPITNDTDNTIIFQLPNGTNFPREAVLITDCKIIDKTDSDAEYTFATTTEFLDKLEELNYPYINTGGGGGAGTNLGYTPSASNGVVTSSTGTDATISLADGTNAGLSENNLRNGEKAFLETASGLDLGDYATTTDTVFAIGEALTSANTYTDNALEDYTNTTDLNTLLGLATTATPNLGGGSVNYAEFIVPTLENYLYLIWDFREATPLELCFSDMDLFDVCCICVASETLCYSNLSALDVCCNCSIE